MPDPSTLAIVVAGIFVIAFMKGAFGGGFAIAGIPLLSLTTDPITAGTIMAPLLLLMDAFALRYWKPTTWSKPDLVVLLPGMVAGIGLGWLLIAHLDKRLVAIAMALITLAFAAHWILGLASTTAKPRSVAKGLVCGTLGGLTSMVAHAGGPPLAIYLLPLGLPKAIYAGTTSLFFAVGNIFKIGPWLALGAPSTAVWMLIACAAPAVPLGVWAGWHFHQKLDQAAMLRWLYGLLVATALKLLYDGVRGFL